MSSQSTKEGDATSPGSTKLTMEISDARTGDEAGRSDDKICIRDKAKGVIDLQGNRIREEDEDSTESGTFDTSLVSENAPLDPSAPFFSFYNFSR